uniref:Translation initiation factor 1 n=1 Tax=Ulmus densa TaxID=1055329 RepID=A0A8K1QU88_9ROSA|nr:translation initiation factor 1 [Ulmus laevis]UDY70858.1 translation initiation factor 1 [Ulmus densa]UQM89205.1 translation initiation factor 1 [Ulmus pumila]URW97114.1 translation initiation factor 1 [Ulmus laevis]
MLWIHLDNEDLILGYVSGRIRRIFFYTYTFIDILAV